MPKRWPELRETLRTALDAAAEVAFQRSVADAGRSTA